MLASVFICSAVTVASQEPDRATVELRNGSKVEGRIEALGNGVLFLRVSLADQRRIPVGDVALIDRKGGASGLPATELREARGADHLLLLVGGSSVKGQLIAIRGGEGSGEDQQPRTYVFRSLEGQERSYGQSQVARIYLGAYPSPAAATVADPAPADVPSGGIRVPARSDWTSTGVIVRKGDRVSFATSGEVQLSDNPADRAKSAGSTRMARNSPLPSVGAGALIGRVGRVGQPFGIGDQTSVPMPADGELFLSVNDDERADNAGEFVIVMTPARRR